MEGYFKVHRKILYSQVFAHQIALKIWIWCLAKVTFKERFVSIKSGKGKITVKLFPGQFIFGRFKAEEELNIDGSTIYKWMQKFASDEFDMIKIESNNQYSIITICKWEEYQNGDSDEVTTIEQPSNSQVTAKEQPSNTNKKDNKDNNDKNIEKRKQEFEQLVFECDPLKYNQDMLQKFCNYWTEKNKSCTKMKFEMEKTFEIKNRLDYWNSRSKTFNNGFNSKNTGRQGERTNDLWK